MGKTVQPGALAVNMGLHVFVLCFTVVILEREGRPWDAIICEAGERGRAIVHDVEATNAMVIMVVDEESRKIVRLPLVVIQNAISSFVSAGAGLALP